MRLKSAIYLSVILCCFIIGLVMRKKHAPWQQLVTSLLGVTFLSETTAYLCAKLLKINTFVYHFFNPIQYIVFGLIFLSMANTKGERRTIIASIAFIIISAIINAIFFQDLRHFNSNILACNALLIVSWSLYFFRKSILGENLQATGGIINTWLLANCIFFICSFFIFGLYEFWQEASKTNGLMKSISSIWLYVLNIIYYLVTGSCLLFRTRKDHSAMPGDIKNYNFIPS